MSGVRVRVAVAGASGYTGGMLAEYVLAHPACSLVGAFGSGGRSGSTPLGELHPQLRGRTDLTVLPGEAEAILATDPDVVFLATPHEASAELAPRLAETGVRVLDLSAAFRLADPAAYPRHYGFEHPRPDLLAEAVYGLPELHRERLGGARLVAVPGCYPTSVILPLRPLLRAGALDGERVIVDSTSGVSGAGRSPSLKNLFGEVHQQAYGLPVHRHQPEMAEHAGVAVLFTPHLGPYERGILSTIHADLAEGWNGERVRRVLEEAYAGEPFVRVLPPGVWPSVGAVRGTNFCDIGVVVDEGMGRGGRAHVRLFGAIDNLVKGASGQAVQAMNAVLGLDEGLGLPPGRCVAGTRAGAKGAAR